MARKSSPLEYIQHIQPYLQNPNKEETIRQFLENMNMGKDDLKRFRASLKEYKRKLSERKEDLSNQEYHHFLSLYNSLERIFRSQYAHFLGQGDHFLTRLWNQGTYPGYEGKSGTFIHKFLLPRVKENVPILKNLPNNCYKCWFNAPFQLVFRMTGGKFYEAIKNNKEIPSHVKKVFKVLCDALLSSKARPPTLAEMGRMQKWLVEKRIVEVDTNNFSNGFLFLDYLVRLVWKLLYANLPPYVDRVKQNGKLQKVRTPIYLEYLNNLPHQYDQMSYYPWLFTTKIQDLPPNFTQHYEWVGTIMFITNNHFVSFWKTGGRRPKAGEFKEWVGFDCLNVNEVTHVPTEEVTEKEKGLRETDGIQKKVHFIFRLKKRQSTQSIKKFYSSSGNDQVILVSDDEN